jgi:hypothetical protein
LGGRGGGEKESASTTESPRDASERRFPALRSAGRSTIWTTGAELLARIGDPSTQLGSGVLAFEHAHLLPQGRKLKSESMPRAEECAEPSKESLEKPGHRNSLHD